MRNVFEKIKYILIGIIVGMLGYLGIRTFSERYRSVKRELRDASNKLDSIENSIELAEELEFGTSEEFRKLKSSVARERSIIEQSREELRDDESILESSESRLRECEDIIKECGDILKKYYF